MADRKGQLVLTLGVLLTLLSTGCGGGDLGVVTGTATYDGNAIEKGYVTFLPVDGKGSTAGGPIENGKFRVVGLTPGKKRVQVTAGPPAPPGGKPISYADLDKMPPRTEVVPPNAVNNNQEIDIKPGEQLLELKLEKPIL
jgi:hypothetical protein